MTRRWRSVTTVTGPGITNNLILNIKLQAEETEVRSTLFSCLKHSHSSCYVERYAAPAVALRYQPTLYK